MHSKTGKGFAALLFIVIAAIIAWILTNKD